MWKNIKSVLWITVIMHSQVPNQITSNFKWMAGPHVVLDVAGWGWNGCWMGRAQSVVLRSLTLDAMNSVNNKWLEAKTNQSRATFWTPSAECEPRLALLTSISSYMMYGLRSQILSSLLDSSTVFVFKKFAFACHF